MQINTQIATVSTEILNLALPPALVIRSNVDEFDDPALSPVKFIQ